MYERSWQGWLKHLDFVLLDIVSLQIAYVLAVALRLHGWAYSNALYRNLGIVLVLMDVVVLVLHNSMHNVLKRDLLKEVFETLKHCFYVFALIIIYLFAMQSGDAYSRLTLFLFGLFYVVLGFGMRELWKWILIASGKSDERRKRMLVVSSADNIEELLTRLQGYKLADQKIIGAVLTEKTEHKSIQGYDIVCDLDSAADYINREWVDSVYIDAPMSDERILKLMDDCSLMGVPTHYHIPNMSHSATKRFYEKVCGTTVLTTSINYITPVQALIKRALDIVAGLIGSLAALLIIAIVGPIIKKESPGPILFKQERVGRNGKRFKIYKIRSMYMDAEERKKDLMAQNRVKDGMMFKLEFDPRIIGNKILPDGTKKTGIGEFIRKTSLDEFPQFFNVLQGTMSTIGTRPPTIDEYNKYQYHHRARLAIKPGITGMWQTSGRSEITDFEEVVRLDTEYILNWSVGLDIKILFKTIGAVLAHKGAM